MLIPKFELAQSESKLFITVHAKYAKIEDADLFIEDCIVRFYCKPYSLHLKLPGKLQDIAESSAVYNRKGDTYIISVNKAVNGEMFKDLDMVSKFIVKKRAYTICPRAESLDSEGTGELSSSDVSDEENIIDLNEEEESLEQMQKEGACCLTPSKPKYGFGNRFYKAFLGFTHEILELLDLEDPDGTPKRSRSKLKVSKELSDFKEEHYLADLFEEEVTEAVINYQPVWLQENFDSTVSLTEEEFDRLKEIPMNVWSKDTRMSIYLGAVDILLAYCYDNRTTEGDPTSESAWTINKLSSTLSWLQKFKDLKSVLASFMRRSLCYPLYRNWNLSLKVVEDVESMLRCKKLYLQKCFLGIHSMFNNSEPRYMLNRIYIDDYCHWVAHADEKILNQIADDIKKIKFCKDDVGLNLPALEAAALVALAENSASSATSSDVDELTSLLEKGKISKDDSDLDSDDLSSESSESSGENSEADDEETLDSDDTESKTHTSSRTDNNVSAECP